MNLIPPVGSRLLLFCLAGLAVAAMAATNATAGSTVRVSVDANGQEASGPSDTPAISANGRFVAFQSSGDNLVPLDLNGLADIFVHDRLSGITERVSVDLAGGSPDHASANPSISGDGRYVAFESDASDLVAGENNAARDVFVYDRSLHVTRRVSVDSAGVEGNQSSELPSISVDGRFVAFLSNATNLVSGDTNGFRDVFVRDLVSNTTERVSVGPGGAQSNGSSSSPSISADGRFVAFQTIASNLTIGGDTNAFQDVYVFDRLSMTATLASVSSSGALGNSNSAEPSISSDGSFVTFQSTANNLVLNDMNGLQDVFVRDLGGAATSLVSVSSSGVQANQLSELPAISGEGRFIVFQSGATNLVGDDLNARRDVFVHDRQSGETRRASVSSADVEGNGDSRRGAISQDGSRVAFLSGATNLVSDDTNNTVDIFLNDDLTLRVPALGLLARGVLLGLMGLLALRSTELRFGSTARLGPGSH